MPHSEDLHRPPEKADATRATLAIPYTLFISAISVVEDVERCICSQPQLHKNVCQDLYLLALEATEWQHADPRHAAAMHQAVADLIRAGRIVAAHDVSDGGVLTTLVEMAIAGDAGLRIMLGDWSESFDAFTAPVSGYIVQPAAAENLQFLHTLEGVGLRRVATLDAEERVKSVTITAADPARSSEPDASATAPLSELVRAWRGSLDGT